MAIASKGRADFPSQAAAPPALPKGELSPKVNERASQAPLNGNSKQGEGRFPSQAAAPPALPKGEPSCAMTNLEASRIRRGAGTSLAVPPSRVIARREAPLALPLGELSPKVNERASRAPLNGNSKQGEGRFPSQAAAPPALPKGEPSPAAQGSSHTIYLIPEGKQT